MADPFSCPDAFAESLEVQGAASQRGFDWPDVSGVLDKVEEEVREIREALAQGDVDHARRELGDLLLITVNLSRFLGQHPGEALHEATQRFLTRFRRLESLLAARSRQVEDCSLEELDAVWNEVKRCTEPHNQKPLDKHGDHRANSTFH